GGFDVVDMDKNIRAAIIGQDEAKSTICVEELHPASWHAQLIRSQRTAPRRPAGRSMQASTAFAPSMSQQAFKHAASIRIAGVISARVTPISKMPLDGAGFGH